MPSNGVLMNAPTSSLAIVRISFSIVAATFSGTVVLPVPSRPTTSP